MAAVSPANGVTAAAAAVAAAPAAAPDIESRKEALLEEWSRGPLNLERRDALLEELRAAGLFPRLMEAMDMWESEAGLYPDVEDPRFIEKLLSKQEFQDSKQPSIQEQLKRKVDPCDPDREYELTPVQRFVGRFLSPQCPYQSALLYHGVGVGKTCAAITIAENYLRSYPRRSVFIIAPRNIQAGFKRTIFDDEALKIGEGDGVPNTAKGCTGNSYLKRTGTEFERDKATILRRVKESIQTRYTVLGYIQFNSYIEDILRQVPRGLEGADLRREQMRVLRREFSGRLVIIDEAHNLRDVAAAPVGGDDDADAAGGETELTEAEAGKKLTPNLLKVLESAEGMKLVLATATPMYNSYKEIIFLLNLLLINDKRDKRVAFSESLVFQPNGRFRKGGAGGALSGQQILGSVANAYVSFMRGENPLSFPVRLPPQGEGVTPLTAWPPRDPRGETISDVERDRMVRLPIVPVTFEGESARDYERISTEAIERGGIGIVSIDEMVQAGNWLFPGEEGVRIRDMGFNACFQDLSEEGGGGVSVYKAREGVGAKWLLADALGTVSPKAKLVIQRLKTCRGVAFVYSRFIKSGSLPLALALEANGYTPWGDRKPLLADGPQDGKGRQCALCARREVGHGGAGGHTFVPARYVLITGKAKLSPNNPKAIQAARERGNMDGREVKVILGSSVASEGVDFRFVREIYVFDSWFHLNKMEQVLGRGIRTCSHALLPKEQRNCTIHLLVNTFAADQDTETADLTMYRNALSGAIKVGRVTRVLKQYALDCNLNRDAILVTKLKTQRHVDSQGAVREAVNINDTPFTNLCDWIETCEYDCAPPIDFGELGPADTSTYDEYAVRWREVELKRAIRYLFERRKQPAFTLENIADMMSGVPLPALAALLSEIVGNKAFQVKVRGLSGYIIYRNGYYLFQPDHLSDQRIPLALRVAEVPVRKDVFEPGRIVPAAAAAVAASAAAAPAAAKEEAEAPAEAAPATAAAPAAAETPAPALGTLAQYWGAIKGWAETIAAGTAPEEDIPEEVMAAIKARYVGDEQTKEREQMIMINWFYETIKRGEYVEERRREYLAALGQALLEFVWDESLRGREQLLLVQNKEDEPAQVTAREQIVRSSGREAFRYVDPITGKLVYICGTAACSEAVARVFDEEPTDALKGLRANRETAGRIYGFNVPKAKEGRLIFKTQDTPVAPGTAPGKGAECAIVSTISYHIQMLKDMGTMMTELGHPRFLLVDEVLDEKARLKKEKAEAKAAGRKIQTVRNPKRSFENAIRACALKNIVLRWVDAMEEYRDGARGKLKYFYRPVAALRSGHKGAVAKGGAGNSSSS